MGKFHLQVQQKIDKKITNVIFYICKKYYKRKGGENCRRKESNKNTPVIYKIFEKVD